MPAARAEEAVRSGCDTVDIQEMVSGGSIETRGEVLWPSTSTRLASSKLQPSKISSSGRGDLEWTAQQSFLSRYVML